MILIATLFDSSSNVFNVTAVGEIFQNTLHHALSVHPTHTAWLRIEGDVMYGVYTCLFIINTMYFLNVIWLLIYRHLKKKKP